MKNYTDRTVKNTVIEAIYYIFGSVIFCLSIIGDGVIIIGKGTFILLKTAFSIIKYLLYHLVHFLKKKLSYSDNLYKRLRFFCLSEIIPAFRQTTNSTKISLVKLIKGLTPKISLLIQTGLIYIRNFLLLTTDIIRKFQLPSPPKIPQIIFPKIPLLKLKPHPMLLGFAVGTLVTFFFGFIPYNMYLFMQSLPDPNLLSQRTIPVTSQIYDRSGKLLYEIHGDEDRVPIKLENVPQIVKQATIAIEDKSFYQHPGFSLIAIARAARETFINHNTQGGSTITQQLIKNALLTREVTIPRKIREIILAAWAEKLYSKNQILEMYLNQVPYGGTSWGIEAASQTYFGKNVADLSLAQAAYLAGLPAAPTLYSPYGSRPDLAKVRQAEVLDRMTEDGYISRNQADAAKMEELNIKPNIVNIKAPHFVMYLRQLLSQKFGNWLVDQGGLRVITTLDLNLQDKAQEIVTNNINSLTKLKVGNGAALITQPKTGDILAMVGSRDYFNKGADGNVNVTLSLRQPGSSIKVVTYSAAFEKGFTAASVIDDSPVSYPSPWGPTYSPVNYDGRFHGRVTVRQAFANSYNVPAVKVLNQIGLNTMIEQGKRMGISTWDDDSRFGLSLTLGGGDVTLMDMNTVYGSLANSGNRVDLDPLLRVTDYKGRLLYEKGNPKQTRALPSETAFILSDILADNQARSAAFGPNSTLVIPGKTVAVKTGTTNDKRDNWTFGYTPSFVVGVWVGNNDNSPMDPNLTSGITGAAPIWNQIMTEILKDKPNETFSKPDNVISLNCNGKSEYFVKGTESRFGCGPKASINNQITIVNNNLQNDVSPLPQIQPSPAVTVRTIPVSKPIRPKKNRN